MVKFYRCNHCGNIVMMVHDSKVPMMCCGEKMTELVAGSTDAAVEKHVPVVDIKSNSVEVSVGSVMHPMEEEHYIMWIYLETNRGGQIKYLNPGEDAMATFLLNDEKPKVVYAYCNLHGLWKKEI
ncbi:MAG TPA: desulfoferrodoxin [Candidatus Fimihabitans intestinipullorum]|uniref:Desulfoferrodoxin n=1 Tax=Candidatus Fimihabitans intestinipullorum TaxID=2840820 RepID=A0A9D1HX52_9BACT|nr:desulfoferrodoxin [Candidatus Fimihabitans intestinipullorum]